MDDVDARKASAPPPPHSYFLGGEGELLVCVPKLHSAKCYISFSKKTCLKSFPIKTCHVYMIIVSLSRQLQSILGHDMHGCVWKCDSRSCCSMFCKPFPPPPHSSQGCLYPCFVQYVPVNKTRVYSCSSSLDFCIRY